MKAQPVVHFEVIGSDPEQLRSYYGDLFGWEFDTPSPVAREVSDPERYGFRRRERNPTRPRTGSISRPRWDQ